jgi:hypothetical protein
VVDREEDSIHVRPPSVAEHPDRVVRVSRCPAREVVSDFMGTPEDGARERSLCEKIYVWWGADDEGVYSLSERGQSETGEFERTFRR